jgi:hypothetical protein
MSPIVSEQLAFLIYPGKQKCLDTLSMIAEFTASFGIAFKCFNGINEQEMLQALPESKSAVPDCDAVYIPSESRFTENRENIFHFGETEKIVIISKKEVMIQNGRLMGTVAKSSKWATFCYN